MRLKLGRPAIADHCSRFDVPESDGTGLRVTFLGVSTLLLDDGTSAILTDGFFSRPGLLSVGLGRIAPNEDRIAACLAKAGIDRLDAVLPVHSHFDHAMDSAVVAARTGARLIGGTSTANIGRGGGLAEERITVVTPGEPIVVGPWTLTLVASHHCPPDRYPGEITEPVRPPVKAAAYKCGEAWSILVAHDSGRTALVQGSAGFVTGSLAGRSAEVAYLGIGQLGIQDQDYLASYWAETVSAVGARRVVLTHWDDFFSPLPMTTEDPPLRALPYAGDDLDVTLQAFTRFAERDGVALSFPVAWRRENPWA
ncbi:MBL fold metallo-hydrolase [Nocardioides marmoriginsengisoli]|uniref:MBL fold metallo-hydrolase n=1 Tax=Nocardioides marmoriginsengisoli TaxID=661483 RepID=A0A3N0CQX5_9ACTN|nr:MBL fold metallo-hydrolase [Nocardioides marmoriginsengisoli]RNL65313.1 MBL fold metallo-hydrolase [Nocardioides marmoriginsengisoli]